jgi:hypothetical protein
MKEELEEFYSATFKLPLWLLCGVTVMRRKMQFLISERSFLCGITVARRTMENPHIHREVVRDSPKVNVWCDLMKNRIVGPFFFMEATVTCGVYLNMDQFMYHQVADLQSDIIYQQDGAPPYWSLHV